MFYHRDEIQDYLVIEKHELIVLPFFKHFDDTINAFISEHLNRATYYVIWGGVASNLLLQFMNLTPRFFSVHDVELFLVQKNKVFYNYGLYSALNRTFKRNGLLPIGGIPVVRRLKDSKLSDFQINRLMMKDGDLYMNSISLEVFENHIKFAAPLNQIERLINKDLEVIVKDFDDLKTGEKVERRIVRTIPKIIRLQKVSNFYVGKDARVKLGKMAAVFKSKTLNEDFYLNIVSETIMRISILNIRKLEDVDSLRLFKDEYRDILSHELLDLVTDTKLRRILNSRIEIMTKSLEKYNLYINDNSFDIVTRYSLVDGKKRTIFRDS